MQVEPAVHIGRAAPRPTAQTGSPAVQFAFRAIHRVPRSLFRGGGGRRWDQGAVGARRAACAV